MERLRLTIATCLGVRGNHADQEVWTFAGLFVLIRYSLIWFCYYPSCQRRIEYLQDSI